MKLKIIRHQHTLLPKVTTNRYSVCQHITSPLWIFFTKFCYFALTLLLYTMQHYIQNVVFWMTAVEPFLDKARRREDAGNTLWRCPNRIHVAVAKRWREVVNTRSAGPNFPGALSGYWPRRYATMYCMDMCFTGGLWDPHWKYTRTLICILTKCLGNLFFA